MSSYLTARDNFNQIIIEKSQFLTYLFHIDSDTEAVEKLNDLRKKYYDSSHICYAYVADICGNVIKFSDDGEPGGTAGQPIFEVIRNNNLKCVLVAVVRYFGGVKLGAGGLVRAYSRCASEVIKSAEIITYSLCNVFDVTLSYSLVDKFKNFCSKSSCNIVGQIYDENVTVTVAVSVEVLFAEMIQDFSAGSAAVRLVGTEYCSSAEIQVKQ